MTSTSRPHAAGHDKKEIPMKRKALFVFTIVVLLSATPSFASFFCGYCDYSQIPTGKCVLQSGTGYKCDRGSNPCTEQPSTMCPVSAPSGNQLKNNYKLVSVDVQQPQAAPAEKAETSAK
jgi:hypothetical protein